MVDQKTLLTKFLIFTVLLVLSSKIMGYSLGPGTEGNFFYREPKWSNLHPSGGSLVSGRGHFKPGYVSEMSNYKYYLHDPLLLRKRSEYDYDQDIF